MANVVWHIKKEEKKPGHLVNLGELVGPETYSLLYMALLIDFLLPFEQLRIFSAYYYAIQISMHHRKHACMPFRNVHVFKQKQKSVLCVCVCVCVHAEVMSSIMQL